MRADSHIARILIIWCVLPLQATPRQQLIQPPSPLILCPPHRSAVHASFFSLAQLYLYARALPALGVRQPPEEEGGNSLSQLQLAKGAGCLLFLAVSITHGVTLVVEKDPFRLKFSYLNFIVSSVSAHSYLREYLQLRDFYIIDSFGNNFDCLRLIVW